MGDYRSDYEYADYYYDHHHSNRSFQHEYRCYPVSFISKEHLENGDKIVMPPSALAQLSRMNIDYPMVFELHNPTSERVSHCGVMEFVAEEGVVYLPDWMMTNMDLRGGGIVSVKNATVPKATYVKLQPHTKDFLDISNPRAALEKALRKFSCLTAGDTIVVPYGNKKFSINILEAKPAAAVSVIETDCEVDFASPLDYVEPEKVAPTPKTPVKEETPAEEPKFVPLMGVSRRLDGKLVTQLAQPAPTPILKWQQPEATSNQSVASSAPSCRQAGKLVFGSNGGQAPKSTVQVPKEQSNPEPEKLKFQAFAGKKYSLLD